MDLIDGSETKDGRVAGSSTVDVYSLGGEEEDQVRSSSSGFAKAQKVFSLQFHAGKRRDDILKDPGGSDGFSQTPKWEAPPPRRAETYGKTYS